MNEMHEIVVSPNAQTVWINGADGSCIARFDTRFGLDVHRTATEQIAGEGECIYCTHERPSRTDWLKFCEQVKIHHHIDVPTDLICAPEWSDCDPCYNL